MAYGDYNDMADLIYRLVRFVVNKVFGTDKLVLEGHEIDFSKPFPKVSIIDLIKRETGADFLSVETVEDARALANRSELMLTIVQTGARLCRKYLTKRSSIR